ncbi:MAG TPA: hypothetical protein VHY91_20165 [Pirellulales bacterium]|nr:hypothetical protein [Pirellulales bacterium]
MARPSLCASLSAAIVCFGLASECLAQRALDAVVPASTKAFAITANFVQLLDNWNKTEFGHLYHDPKLEPFRKDIERQLDAKGFGLEQQIGLSLDELKGLASGEVAVALIPTPDGHGTMALMADVTGNVPQAQAKLNKMTATFKRRGGTQGEQVVAGVNLTMFNLPPAGKNKMPQAAYGLRGNLLLVSDNIGTAATLLRRLAAPPKLGLDTVPAYRAVMERAAKDNPHKPDLKWYVNPIGLLEMVETDNPRAAGSGPDPLKIAKSEGFDAVQGVGGVVSLAVGPYGAVHRTSVYAPPPYQRAMRMAEFANGGKFKPQDWVPANVSSYTSFNWDMLAAFDSFGTLFDAIFGEGEENVFSDVIKSLKEDPNGPQIDLRNDLVAHLGNRGTVLTDVERPLTPHSQRRIFAAEAKNPAALAEAIEKSMRNDPGVKKRTFEGHTIFEILPEDEEAEGTEEANKRPGPGVKVAGGQGGGRLLPNSAVTVAHGTLFVSTHVSFLEKILSANPQGLATTAVYREVEAHLQKLGATNVCMLGYNDNAEQWYLAYELFRTGKLPESDLVVASILNAMFPEAPDGEVRKQQLDGSKLPDYSLVRHYLGTGGIYAQTEPGGWFLLGFSLSKANPPGAQAAAVPAP